LALLLLLLLYQVMFKEIQSHVMSQNTDAACPKQPTPVAAV
jgi:hypothetical protein